MEILDTGDDHYWQMAGDRVLLYLRCLNFEAPRALKVTLEAIEAAKQNPGTDPDMNPVTVSMLALRSILDDESREDAQEADRQAASENDPEGRYIQTDTLISMPPVHRLSMIQEDISPPRREFLLRNAKKLLQIPKGKSLRQKSLTVKGRKTSHPHPDKGPGE